MPKKMKLKPGAKAPASGQYLELGPKGGKGSEVTAIKGKTLPPTKKKGGGYVLVDKTKNKSGQGRASVSRPAAG